MLGLGLLTLSAGRFAGYYGLILQKHIFNEWRGTDIDEPLGRPAPKPALSLESLQRFILNAGRDTKVIKSPAKLSANPILSLQSTALERCAALIKRACGGELSSDLVDELASKNFLQAFQEIPFDNPNQADEVLCSHGKLIGVAYANDASNKVLQKNLTAWVRTLALAGDAHTVSTPDSEVSLAIYPNPCQQLSTRLAAVHSIEGFLSSVWKFSSKDTSSPAPLGVYLALWDTLVDDDEDVRDLGAKIASQLLSRTASVAGTETNHHLSLSPPATRPRLVQLMLDHYSQSSSLWREAIWRLTGMSTFQGMLQDTTAAGSSDFICSWSVMLEVAKTPDTALFVEEKQNLYIDEVEEARFWADALSAISSAEALADMLRRTLATWTTRGLAFLSSTVEDEQDGPFGWTSKPEVFTLGMRLILAAKVLICHATKADTCKTILKDILRKGTEGQLHDLWIAEILELLTCAERLEGLVLRP